MNWTWWIFCSGLLGAMGVGAGAFGGHALKSKLTMEQLATYDIAVRYQFYHAFALLGVALLASHVDNWLVKCSGWLFLCGSIFFSGSLYLLVLTSIRWMGFVTPIGGGLLILGWLFLAAASR